MKLLIYFLFFLFVLFSGVTWNDLEEGGLINRLTISEPISIALILLGLFGVLFSKEKKIYLPSAYKVYILYLFVCLVGAVFARFPDKSLAALIIHTYIFSVSVFCYNLYIDNFEVLSFEVLAQLLTWAVGIIAVIGLLQFLFFPHWFLSTEGGLSGTFRNTGQAGTYFGIFLALIISFLLSGVLKRNVLNFFICFTVFLALIFTFKRAAQIGFLIGVFLLTLQMLKSKSIKDKKNAVYFISFVAVFLPFVLLFFSWAILNVDGMQLRLDTKILSLSRENVTEGFFMDNVKAAITAFSISPLVGVGLGNIGSGYITEEYEIHSTYLGVLALNGLLGVVSYSLFMFYFLRGFKIRVTNKYSRFIEFFYPFLIGLIVSWIYTTHLRKREFWIMVFICLAAYYTSKKSVEKHDSHNS